MASPKATSTIHRVLKIDESTREGAKNYRAEHGLTVAQFIEAACAELPAIVDDLLSKGLWGREDSARPARLPFRQEDLWRLAVASGVTGLDQSQLLLVAFRKLTNAKAPAKSGAPAKPLGAKSDKLAAKPAKKATKGKKKATTGKRSGKAVTK